MPPTSGIDLVPSQTAPARRAPRPHVALWVFPCVVGSLMTLFAPALGTAVMVFAVWRLVHGERNRAWMALLGCVLPMVAVCLVTWDYGSLVVPCVACALAVALLLPGRITITSFCLLVMAVTGLMIVADATLVMQYGESFAAYVNELFEEFRVLMTAQLDGSGSPAAVQVAVEEALGLFEKVWPLMYVVRAAAVVVLGLAGLALARRDTPARIHAAFLRYDAPLWCVVALAAAFALLVVGMSQASWGPVAHKVAVNLLICLRALFFLQGLAVILFALDRREKGGFARVLILTCAVLGELGLCAVSVFGVIDVWANLRGLARGSATRKARSVGTLDKQQ